MIYVSTSCIKQKRIKDIVVLLQESGINNIELSGGTDYYDGIDDDLASLKERYALRFACHAYFPPSRIPFVVNLASCNDVIYKQSIEHYDKCIEMLRKIDCSVLSVHAGFMVEISKDEIGRQLKNYVIYDENEAYSRFCYAYEDLANKCKQNGIKLYLENNVLSWENYKAFEGSNYFMMTNYESIMYMKDQLKFNLLLDLAHLHVSCRTLGYEYMDECRLLKDYVRWIHISENDGICDEHKALNDGGDILTAFEKTYKRGVNVTLETSADLKSILNSIELVEKASGGEKQK